MNPLVYFTLGRPPTSNDHVIGYIVQRIAGQDYIRYTFADEMQGMPPGWLWWLLWADISMQTQILAASPTLSSIHPIDST